MSEPRSVLLVSPDAEQRRTELLARRPDLRITAAASDTAARAYLGATSFDAVIVDAAMPRETAPSLGALAEALGRPGHLISSVPPDELGAWLHEHLAPASVPVDGDAREPAAPPLDAGSGAAVLHEIKDELSRIAHAMNNPLAVIDGNAQLALELSRALDVDGSVVSAIEDVQAGSQSLAALFREIAQLRERIDAVLA